MIPPRMTLGYALGFLPLNQRPQPKPQEKLRYDAHTKTDKKELDKIAQKQGFKSWQKMITKITVILKKEFAAVKLLSRKGLDIVEKDINWLGVILHHAVSMPLDKAIEKALTLRQEVLVGNFSTDYSTSYKATILDFWSGKDIESVANPNQQLFGLEKLYLLAASLITFCLDSSRTTAFQTLFEVWQYEGEFWEKDQTTDPAFLKMENTLIEMFSENVSADVLLTRINGEDKVNWHKDPIMLAFYGYFNKYCTWLNKPKELRQRMVFTAVFFFVSYIDNKSEMQYGLYSLSFEWQALMIDSLLEDWRINE